MNFLKHVPAVLMSFLFVQLATAENINFQPWSENLFVQIEKEFGEAGAERIRNLHELIIKNREKPDDVKLKVTNDAINQLPWITDRAKYDANDYWATPLETIATFGGDCEDMAIAKHMMLRLMGIPKQKLRLTYVKIKKTGEAHMVLVYIPDPDKPLKGQSLLLLDNFVKTIKPAIERKDLLGVYMVDGDNNLTLISDDGKSRKIKAEINNKKFEKLDKIKQKIAENRIKYQQYNDGRPLY